MLFKVNMFPGKKKCKSFLKRVGIQNWINFASSWLAHVCIFKCITIFAQAGVAGVVFG